MIKALQIQQRKMADMADIIGSDMPSVLGIVLMVFVKLNQNDYKY